MSYQSRPTVHTSWYGCRRRSHWSPTSAAKAKDSTELRNGRTTLKSTAEARLREPTASSGASEGWSPRPGSNRRPLPYQGSALPAELRGPAATRHPWSTGPRSVAGSADSRQPSVNVRKTRSQTKDDRSWKALRMESVVGREGIEPPQSKDG